MSRPPLPLRDRVLLGAVRALPRAVARHLMFLMNTRPELADSLGYHVRPSHYYEPLPDFQNISAAAAACGGVTGPKISSSCPSGAMACARVLSSAA